jgi:hypothetical protein
VKTSRLNPTTNPVPAKDAAPAAPRSSPGLQPAQPVRLDQHVSTFVVSPSAQRGDARPLDSAAAPAHPAKASTKGYNLTFQGGKVLSSPQLQPIYLGDYWGTAQGASDRSYNDGFCGEVVGGKHEGLLGQYGVAAGSFAPSVAVPGAPTRVTEADVISLVKGQLASGAVKDGPQTVHMVVLPPGTVLDAGGGVDSTQGLGGFHGSYLDGTGKPVYFGVVAYSEKGNGIDFDGKPRDNVTITESHEFDEAATDPDVEHGKIGWYNKKYGEIGDLAVNSGLVPLSQAYVKDEKGYAVQVEWSNKDGKFLGVGPTAAAPAKPGPAK